MTEKPKLHLLGVEHHSRNTQNTLKALKKIKIDENTIFFWEMPEIYIEHPRNCPNQPEEDWIIAVIRELRPTKADISPIEPINIAYARQEKKVWADKYHIDGEDAKTEERRFTFYEIGKIIASEEIMTEVVKKKYKRSKKKKAVLLCGSGHQERLEKLLEDSFDIEAKTVIYDDRDKDQLDTKKSMKEVILEKKKEFYFVGETLPVTEELRSLAKDGYEYMKQKKWKLPPIYKSGRY